MGPGSTVIVTRPNHDVTTNYLYHWNKAVLEEAKTRNLIVIDLAGQKANKAGFSGRVKKTKPRLFILNGHGSETAITGHDNQPLIVKGENEDLLSEGIAYALSCKSADGLGAAAIKAGAKAYIGYSDDFVFVISSEKISRPLEDELANYFMVPTNRVAIALVKSNSAGDAHESSREVLRKIIRKLSSSDTPAELGTLLPYLFSNYSNQVSLGDQTARI